MTKRMLFGTLAAAGTTVALAMPSTAPATELVAPSSAGSAGAASTATAVCGSMKPVDCVVYYLTRWDPCLLCDGGEDGARRE